MLQTSALLLSSFLVLFIFFLRVYLPLTLFALQSVVFLSKFAHVNGFLLSTLAKTFYSLLLMQRIAGAMVWQAKKL